MEKENRYYECDHNGCGKKIKIGDTLYCDNGSYFCSSYCALICNGVEESVLEPCFFWR